MIILTENICFFAGPVADRFQIHAQLMAILIIITSGVQVLLFFIPPADIIHNNSGNSSLHNCDNHSMINQTMQCLVEQLIENGDLGIPVKRNLCSQMLSSKDGYLANNWCSIYIVNSSNSKICDRSRPLIHKQVPNANSILEANITCQNQSKTHTFCIACHTNQVEAISSIHRKYTVTFWMYFAVYCVGSLISGPIWSLLNAVAYSSLGEDRNTWGRHRLFGKSHKIC